MTDKKLYQQIRQLVRQQKQKNVLDSRRQDFAEEYCKSQMLKKQQQKAQQPSKIANLFKNFKNLESYINIMDIINKLSMFSSLDTVNIQAEQPEEISQIIPKSIQTKIKEELGPILSKKYEAQSVKRKVMIEELRSAINYGNEEFQSHNNLLKEQQKNMNNGKANQKLYLIDLLRKDIKRKEIYFLQKRFDKELKDIEKVPKKIEDTKLFHKICSYLRMILEQQHKEKWASKHDKMLRQTRRQHSQRTVRLSAMFSSFECSTFSKFTKPTQHTREKSDLQKTLNQNPPSIKKTQSSVYSTNKSMYKKNSIILNTANGQSNFRKIKKMQSKKQLVKENFTFRKRNIKAGVMVKINQFVDKISQEQKKNIELSKKYVKALQSLAQEAKTSYGRFQRQQVAQEEDIQDMKRYLENTLSRNKNDLQKFHHI